MLLGTETLLQSDTKLGLLMLRWKALTVDYQDCQERSPETISTNPYLLLELGKEELQKVKNDLEKVLSAVCSKNKQLEEDLEREQQWCEEQEQIVNSLNRIEEETKSEVEQLYKTRRLEELHNKMLQLKTYKKELLSALGEFLDEHFPLPQDSGSAKNRQAHASGIGSASEDWVTAAQNFSSEPAVELITLQEILEILINKLMTTPHEPYVTINESFWPPYIELLLRFGMALRHPEDPNRMRLEAFHK
ncbi:centromere protein K isoform X2 [Corapipo altera]|uniref:centromere protein K isoform X2 n=1 Tax=Corapipo altera TaxID=415028 RepID=UPI000FD65167|nr:centromere protein K isoform X2 [Corapipo altera]XP_027490813.1 centromere protein K isoform X2 [Corapipo altera]